MRPTKTISFVLKWIARPVISISIIGLLLLSVNIDQVIVRFSSINIGALGLASFITLVVVVIRAYRWRIIALAYGATLSLWTSFQLIQMGNFAGQVLPSSIGGDFVRAWCGYRSGLVWRVSINTIFLDRIFGFVTLLIIIILSIPGLIFMITDIAVLMVLVSLVLASLLLVSSVFLLDKASPWLPFAKFRQEIALFSLTARKFIRNWRVSVPLVFVSMVIHLLFIVAVMVLAAGIGVHIYLYDLVLLLPPVIFLTIMPFSLAGWGVREGAMVFALEYIGVPRVDAFAISVLIGIVAVIISLPGGVFMIRDVFCRTSMNELIAHSGGKK